MYIHIVQVEDYTDKWKKLKNSNSWFYGLIGPISTTEKCILIPLIEVDYFNMELNKKIKTRSLSLEKFINIVKI